MKICKTCKKEKPINEFAKSGVGKYRARCKCCINENWQYRLMSTLTSRESRKKQQKLSDGRIKKTFDRDKRINMKFLNQLKEKQNGMCFWLKIPIDFTMEDKLRKPSLDRLDCLKGYEISNVVLTTVFANTGRRDSTVDEMSEFVKNYL